MTSQNRAIDILTPDAATPLMRVPDAAIASPASCGPDGTAVAAGTVTSRAKVWDVTPTATSEVWSAAAPAPWTAAWVGDALVTMHDDRRLRRYQPGQGLTATSGIATLDVEYPPPMATHADSLVATFPRVEFENDDDAPGFTDGVVLRDAETLEVTRKTPLTGYPQAFDRNGARLLVSKQGSVHILDTATGMPIGTLDAQYSLASHPIAAFLSDGRHAVVDDAYRTYVFDVDTGEIVATVCVQAVGFRVVTSRRGSLFAVDGERGVEVYDAGRLLDAAADAGPVRLDELSPAFECANGNPAAAARTAFLEGIDVRFMALSPDGTRLAAISENGNVSLWDPRAGELKFTIPHHGEVGGGTFSDDGRHLAVTVDDPDSNADTVRIYTLDVDELLEIADAKVTRELTPEECAGYRIADPCAPAT